MSRHSKSPTAPGVHKQTTGTNLQAETPLSHQCTPGIAPAAPSPLHPCTLGFSPLKSRNSCVRRAGNSDECRIHPQEVLKVVPGVVRSCCMSDPLLCALGAVQDGKALPSTLLQVYPLERQNYRFHFISLPSPGPKIPLLL